MEALIAFRTELGQPIYPDANGTLRVTYGTVTGYTPRDGVFYTPFTTVDGLVEKDTGVDPFDAPQGLLEAARQRRFGEYRVDSLDSVPVNYLSDERLKSLEVAMLLGYSSISSFTTAFKSWYDMPPAEYRQKCLAHD